MNESQPKPASLTLRPRTGNPATDAQVYAPHRDLGHNFVSLATEAMNGLRAENQEPWFQEIIKKHDLTGDDLGKAVVAFIKGVTTFTTDKSPQESLEQQGFFETPYAAQFVVAAKFGQVMYGAVFSAVNELTAFGERPPMADGIARMVDEAVTTANILGGQTGGGEGTDKETSHGGG